jgi:hypothetical protein
MMVCGWIINLLQTTKGWQYLHACQIVFFAYAGIGAVKFLLSICLSHKVEAAKKDKNGATASQQQQRAADGPETQPLLGETANTENNQKKSLLSFLGSSDLVSLVITLFVLFGLDSFASGLASLYVLVTPSDDQKHRTDRASQILDDILLQAQVLSARG